MRDFIVHLLIVFFICGNRTINTIGPLLAALPVIRATANLKPDKGEKNVERKN
jgi:hypothetical protein